LEHTFSLCSFRYRKTMGSLDVRRPPWVGKLAVETDGAAFLGAKRVKLLEAVGQTGSISQAAKVVPLSYKAAWDAIDAMNNAAERPLVTRIAGGRQGGGTQLTEYGRKIVAIYRAVETEYQGALDRLVSGLAGVEAEDVRDFQSLLRRSALTASARNQFCGPISALRAGGVFYEVCLRLDERTELVATITRESAEAMGLAIGREVFALVKSSSVLLLTDPQFRLSARNQLWGEIARIETGPVNGEVTLALPGGKAVTAVVTRDSLADLGLAVGKPACAVFKASSVILISHR
jgi:molybdate transport system regulatory protein